MHDDDLLERLRRLGTHPIASAQQSADLTAMAGLRPASPLRSKLRVAGAFLAGLLIGSTGLAAADVLPDPAQHVAHEVLGRVGVSVPDPERYHGPECGDEVRRNHGQYVRDNKDLAQSECGKKVKTPGVDDDLEADGEKPDKPDKAAKPDKGPCAGKPPWAKDKSMTEEQVAAAKAARAAECGPDDDEAEVDEGPEVEQESEIQPAPEVEAPPAESQPVPGDVTEPLDATAPG